LTIISIAITNWLASRACAETLYTPKLVLSEQYDSNVFRTAPEFIPPGKQKWDLITNLGANLEILNKSRAGDTQVNVGVNGSTYVYNTYLSYVGTNGLVTSDLSDWTHELLPGLGLRLTDSFRYTPTQPAFLTGVTAQSDFFTRGVQAYRSNTFTNVFSAHSDYAFSRSMGFRTDYQFAIQRVYSLFATAESPGGQLNPINNVGHTVAAGPTITFDDGDTLFLKYGYQTVNFTGSSIPPFSYTAHSIEPEYVSKTLRGYTVTVSAGATLVEQSGSRTFFSGKFAVRNELDRQTQVTFSVSRQAAPLIVGGGGALISNVAQVYLSYAFSRVVRFTVSANYAYNESTPVKSVTIKGATAGASLNYKVTKSSTLSLIQDYNNFDYNIQTPFSYDRYATMLMFTTEWK
jgi:hypothetical protein